MTLKDALLLGRVSNLPTVWTNALTGLVLAGLADPVTDGRAFKPAFAILGMSLFYVGGMYLNDAFDVGFDAKNSPERPIPSGRVGRAAVFAAGFLLLACGLGATLLAAHSDPSASLVWPGLSGLTLIVAIVVYDWQHKSNPYAPLLMALCRALVYVTAALCVTFPLAPDVLTAAGVVFAYLIGLTYTANQEHLGRVGALWPLLLLSVPVAFGVLNAQAGAAVPFLTAVLAAWIGFCVWLIVRGGANISKGVGNLIAGIALCDAVLLAAAGAGALSAMAVACCALTFVLQHVVPGT